MCYGPYSIVENSKFFCVLVCKLFTGESTHTASEMAPRAPAIHLKSEVSIMLRCQLCATHYTACISDLELFEKHLCNPCIPKETVPRTPVNQLSSEK